MEGSLSNYLRTHRRRSGLSFQEIANIVGYDTKATVAKHERVIHLPPLLTALAYEVLFVVPVSELFAGMREAVEPNVEERLIELEQGLMRSPALRETRRQTLEWIAERRQSLAPIAR